MKVKICKGDTVEIISGKLDDKGKRAEVIKVMPDESRVVVSGINIHTKHQKAVQAQGRTINTGRIKFEAPDLHFECDAGLPKVQREDPGPRPARRDRFPPCLQTMPGVDRLAAPWSINL